MAHSASLHTQPGAEKSSSRFDWPAMTDEAFLKAAEMQLWLSAFASNNPRAPAHKHADEAYAEAQRREKPWLYQRAWNASYRSAGYEPSEREVEQARGPEATTADTNKPAGDAEGVNP